MEVATHQHTICRIKAWSRFGSYHGLRIGTWISGGGLPMWREILILNILTTGYRIKLVPCQVLIFIGKPLESAKYSPKIKHFGWEKCDWDSSYGTCNNHTDYFAHILHRCPTFNVFRRATLKPIQNLNLLVYTMNLRALKTKKSQSHSYTPLACMKGA